MRGKRRRIKYWQALIRITPADAGKTEIFFDRTSCIEDHPRRCGENSASISLIRVPPGSPPQVRGKLPRSKNELLGLGITPAGAGKTLTLGFAVNACKDHPRRCGENWVCAPRHHQTRGSPPQVRGKLSGIRKTKLHDGITPAGAGKT